MRNLASILFASSVDVPETAELSTGDLEKSHAQYFVMVMLINRTFRMP